ncbi:MAG: phosphoribosyl-AMP cyclohydrolase [Actinomycetota bacterium]
MRVSRYGGIMGSSAEASLEQILQSFDSDSSLLPVVVQDHLTNEVLMLAYLNREALKRSVATGRATYWSRSRSELWVKGESSGNVQQIVEIAYDCDGDSLLYRVEQSGVACHTGERSCFFNIIHSKGQ